jgi:hypothetical protein
MGKSCWALGCTVPDRCSIHDSYLARSHQQALIGHRQTIQRAFGDVSDALIGYQKLREVRTRQEVTVADLQESVGLSEMCYRGGTTTHLEGLGSVLRPVARRLSK